MQPLHSVDEANEARAWSESSVESRTVAQTQITAPCSVLLSSSKKSEELGIQNQIHTSGLLGLNILFSSLLLLLQHFKYLDL